MTELSYSARQVHEEFLRNAQNPAWRMAFEIALGEWMRDIATYHQGPIQAIVDRAVMRSLAQQRDDITKRFLLDRITEIRKDKNDFKESDVRRDRRGRFSEEGRGPGPQTRENLRRTSSERDSRERQAYRENRRYDRQQQPRYQQAAAVLTQERQRMMQTGKIPGQTEAERRQTALGLTSQPKVLSPDTSSGDHKAEVLRREAAMTYALAEKTHNEADKQKIQYTIDGPKGPRVVVPPVGEIPSNIDWEAGERVRYMAPIGPDNPVTVAGKVMDIGLVAGMNDEHAAKAGSVTADIHDTFNTTSWGQRLNNVANVARVVSNNSPLASQAAAVAGLVNILGPDAARAFGPKMRQITYRYTGQEASTMQMSPVATGGKQEGESVEGYERRLALDLARTLPRRTEYKAALQAGSTPPSKGYMLDKEGKVVSEAVGFSDDWYTPFNLRKLPKLKDGSYVRTRGYGGITPEDIQLAMRTGAKRVQVVSNSGVFTLEFDERALKFGNRYGFGGAAMHRRYARSLDAIKSSRVTNEDAGSNQRVKLNTRGYDTALRDLKNKFPYFIASVKVEGPINQQARRQDEGEGVIGTPNVEEEDSGYVRPLRIRANGAHYGYNAPGSDASGTYDQLDEYRLRGGGPTQPGGGAPAGGGGGGGRGGGGGGRTFEAGRDGTLTRVGEARSDPPMPGGRMQGRAYDNERIPVAEATNMMDGFKAIFSKHPDIEVPEELEAVRAAALSEKGKGEWQSMRDRLANRLELRESVLTAMDEHYGATKEAQELLPSLSTIGADVGEDEEEDDDDEVYNSNATIPPEDLRRSNLYQAWKRRETSGEDQQSNTQRRKIDLFERVNAVEHAASDENKWNTYNELSAGEREEYDDIQTAVNRILINERELAEDRAAGATEDDENDASRGTGQRGREAIEEINFNPRDALDAPMHRNWAADLANAVMEVEEDPAEQHRKLVRLSEAAKRAANSQPTEAAKEKLFDIADVFDEFVNFMDIEE